MGLKTVETSDGTCYKPDSVTQFLHDVRQFAEEHTFEELNAIGDEIETWKADYEVESVAELRQSIGREDISSEDRRERLDVIEEREYNIGVREAVQLTISLKSSLSTLGEDSVTDGSAGTLPQEG